MSWSRPGIVPIVTGPRADGDCILQSLCRSRSDETFLRKAHADSRGLLQRDADPRRIQTEYPSLYSIHARRRFGQTGIRIAEVGANVLRLSVSASQRWEAEAGNPARPGGSLMIKHMVLIEYHSSKLNSRPAAVWLPVDSSVDARRLSDGVNSVKGYTFHAEPAAEISGPYGRRCRLPIKLLQDILDHLVTDEKMAAAE
jgi:hypothetical protein